MVYGVCRAMLRDVHDAEDAAQQVFLSAHKALLCGARVRDHGGWLATIARNECRGRIAAGMRSPLPAGEKELAAIPSPVDEQARHDQAVELRAALAALPERQREAVVLRYLYGLRYGEVATALGLSRPATEALLFRARRGLRGRLRPVVGTVLVVPLALREELALALPGFSAGAGTGAATVGVAGGVLAKLTAAPVGVKVATAAAAVSTIGAVGTIESDRPVRGQRDAAPIVATSEDQGARSGEESSGSGSDEPTGDERGDEDRSGPGGGGDAAADLEGERSGPLSASGSESGGDSHGGSASGDDGSTRTSGEDAQADASVDATTTDSSGPGSGGSLGDGSSGSSGSGSSGSGESSSGSSGSGSSGSGSSGSGSGSEDPPDDAEP